MPISRAFQRDLDQSAPAPTKPLCPVCTAPSTVYLRSSSLRFADDRCDVCGTIAISALTKRGATDVTLDQLTGVESVTIIEGVDLAAFSRECLDGVVADCDLAAMANIPAATREIMSALSARLRRPLVPSEQLAVGLATHTAYYARRAELKALLKQAQTDLHSPFSVFGSRAS